MLGMAMKNNNTNYKENRALQVIYGLLFFAGFIVALIITSIIYNVTKYIGSFSFLLAYVFAGLSLRSYILGQDTRRYIYMIITGLSLLPVAFAFQNTRTQKSENHGISATKNFEKMTFSSAKYVYKHFVNVKTIKPDYYYVLPKGSPIYPADPIHSDTPNFRGSGYLLYKHPPMFSGSTLVVTLDDQPRRNIRIFVTPENHITFVKVKSADFSNQHFWVISRSLRGLVGKLANQKMRELAVYDEKRSYVTSINNNMVSNKKGILGTESHAPKDFCNYYYRKGLSFIYLGKRGFVDKFTPIYNNKYFELVENNGERIYFRTKHSSFIHYYGYMTRSEISNEKGVINLALRDLIDGCMSGSLRIQSSER